MSLRLLDRALLVKLFYQNDNSTIVALQKFRTLKGIRKGPLSAKNLRLMVTKFEETGSLNVRSGRGRKPVSAEAIEKVALQVEEDKASNVQASTSVRRVGEALDLPRSTVKKIIRNIFRYYPYKLKLVQELLPHDFETQHLFLLQFLALLEIYPEWPWNILWTDEVHFHLDGSVNTHNCRIWEKDNPHSTLQVPLHSPKNGNIEHLAGSQQSLIISNREYSHVTRKDLMVRAVTSPESSIGFGYKTTRDYTNSLNTFAAAWTLSLETMAAATLDAASQTGPSSMS
ncbi:uncharacterized protein TNCV_3188461 [Trichonephila clavipes]|nr:uncharacterized protein TNCV_3188461 [Trichonephila clavipes]